MILRFLIFTALAVTTANSSTRQQAAAASSAFHSIQVSQNYLMTLTGCFVISPIFCQFDSFQYLSQELRKFGSS
ncbi:hypothetical protein B9Z55_000092 [Caenorhabditis nigoni]|uniref:Uncharacterized protein n=1 Tax=Caenorhabditis nigoni TaxID=1611254 RepID=A0A2G5VVG7_9PELO|nr:hypothetical protein B9Z55_000092 [Caenorhabditis nigoni]